jgi:hypothetical protein
VSRPYILTDEDRNDIVDALDIVTRDLREAIRIASPPATPRYVEELAQEAERHVRLRLRFASYAERFDRSANHPPEP